ncbi:MAG: hypothetical protein AAFQ82_09995, partial [Myxococcota bacterium]
MQSLMMEPVRAQLNRVRPELKQANGSALADAFNESVEAVANELELRVNLECPDPSLANPGSNAGNVGHFFTAIYDVFACDLSSSVGFVFDAVGARWGAEARRIDFDHDPAALNFVSSRYYQVSHGRTERHELAQAYVALSRTHRLKDLLDLLATTPENGGDGMLLDNTVIYYGSAMTGNTHAWAGNYAHFIVAGKNTNVKTGWHYDCS